MIDNTFIGPLVLGVLLLAYGLFGYGGLAAVMAVTITVAGLYYAW